MSTGSLRIEGLRVHFPPGAGSARAARAVDGVELSIAAGRTLALVGESGSGKSVTASAVLKLVPEPGRIVGGRVLWKGEDLLACGPARLRAVRGAEIAMVFQDAGAALDPVFTAGHQVEEVLRLRRGGGQPVMPARAARARVLELLTEVGLPEPRQQAVDWPHRLSGGMKQRVALAVALAGEPELLIADEPTTALDVTLQAQVLDLLRRLQERRGIGMLLVTHDFGVVARNAHDVAVMYAGRIVERGERDAVLHAPRHPYTRALLASRPRLDGPRRALEAIPGRVPDARARPEGCAFHPRCPVASERCRADDPRLRPLEGPGAREVACHHPLETGG